MEGKTIVPPMQVPLGTERIKVGSPIPPRPTSSAAGTSTSLVCTSTRGTVPKSGSALTVLPSGKVNCPFPLAALATKSAQLTELSVKPDSTVVRVRPGSRIEVPPSPCTPTAKAVSIPSAGLPGGDSVQSEEFPVVNATLVTCVPTELTVPVRMK